MSIKIEKPELAEDGRRAINGVFIDAIMAYNNSGIEVLFSVQKKIKHTELIVENFIESKPYSRFKLLKLGSDQDLNNPHLSVEVRNFTQLRDSHDPYKFILVLSPACDSVKAFQEAFDDEETLLEVKFDKGIVK